MLNIEGNFEEVKEGPYDVDACADSFGQSKNDRSKVWQNQRLAEEGHAFYIVLKIVDQVVRGRVRWLGKLLFYTN